MVKLLRAKIFKIKEFRYFFAAICNTFLGYFMSLLIYSYCHAFLHILIIGLIVIIFNVSISFFTYKFFVFKTKNHWLKEYLKTYITYGVAITISLCILWFTVDYLKIQFWIAQGFATLISAFSAYLGHNYFTFKINKYE